MMMKLRFLLFPLTVFLSFLLFTDRVLAEGVYNPVIPALKGPGNVGALFGSLIHSLIVALITVAALFTLINLLMGGFTWITSGGDKAALDTARSRIQNAILGLFITASTWVIYILVTTFLGITPAGSTGIHLELPSLFGN